jgi:hypothetical protein
MTTRRGRLVLGALAAAAASLIVIELALGALSFGQTRLADPCTAKPAFKGGGIDGAVQRFALSGLNGAACELHTTREEFVLSFVPSAGTKQIRWDRETIDRALKAGLDRAARDTAGGGLLGSVFSFALRKIVGDPLGFFLGELSGS